MVTKPVETLELHYPMIKFVIIQFKVNLLDCFRSKDISMEPLVRFPSSLRLAPVTCCLAVHTSSRLNWVVEVVHGGREYGGGVPRVMISSLC